MTKTNPAKNAPYNVTMNVVKDDNQAQIDKEIAWLEAAECFANTQHKLAHLCDKASYRFLANNNNDMKSELYKVRFALKQAKSIRLPDIYLKKNQKAFDDFFNQLDLVFKTKLLTYSAEKNKCVYAADYFAGIPSQEWSAEKRLFELDLERVYLFEEFKMFLQEHCLSAHIQTANLVVKIATV